MSFAHLPRELQLMIITNALHTTQMQAPLISTSTAQHVAIDIQQATLLSLVSHSCRAIIVDMLYTHIRITKPSALLQLHRILLQSPNLAAVVRSIHLGPDEELPDKGWWEDKSKGRETRQGPERYIQTTICDNSVLPWTCSPGGSINIREPGYTEQREAVGDAIYAALDDIDVEPWRRGFSASGNKIGVRAWTARLFQVQAVFDLYLMEMKRLEDDYNARVAEACSRPSPPEDEEGSNDSTGSYEREWYPQLQILLDASTPRPSQEQPASPDEEWNFFLVGAQIWEHLTRRGGPVDSFDHLLLLTRSSRASLRMSAKEWRRARMDLGGPLSLRFTDSEWQWLQDPNRKDDEADLDVDYDEEDYESPSEDEDTFPHWIDDESVYEHQPGRDALDGPLNRVEDLIEVGSSLLALLPHVVNLSLTSFLYRALPGLSPTSSKTLRSLVIGPKMRYWDDVLPSDGPLAFTKLERLRIVGKISRSDASKIALELPFLKEVEWELPQRYVSVLNVYANVYRLQGQCDLGSPPAKKDAIVSKKSREARREAGKSGRGSTATYATSNTAVQTPRPQRRTLVLLHPEIVKEVMTTMVPGQEARTAWQEGRALRYTLHPVKVAASQFEVPPDPKEYTSSAREISALYGDAKRWWEEGKRYARS